MDVTPWNELVVAEKRLVRAGKVEIQDLARGLSGALFVSLPLLFTMEMWEIARSIPDPVLIGFLALSIGINRLFLQFSGYRKERWQRSKWWDAVVTMGIGAIASAITLFITGIINFNLDWYLTAKTIALETIPTSMGAAIAINQLGSGNSSEPDKINLSPDLTVLIGTLLGGFLFAFNIGPTMETKVIVLKQAWWQVGATVLFSLAISYLVISLAQFESHDMGDRKHINRAWLESLVSYIVAFIVSLILLAVFGYGTPVDPINVWLPQTVALAYATTLGGAAGRLIL